MVWTVDDSAIKEANKNVDDAQSAVDKAERDIKIADLQLQIDAIQDGIDALEDEKARIQALADESDAFFDKKIADMQEYQNEWEEALEIEERAIAFENLKSMFGDDAIEQILNHNMDLVSAWKQCYADTMAAIDIVSTGTVGAITEEWAKLAGVSVDMENAKALSELSMDELRSKAESLGIAMDDVARSSKDAETALGNTDTSSVNEQLQNTGDAASDTKEQISNVTEKLNALTSDVQNYSIPALDTQQFSASLGGEDGTGGVLGQLNTFVERFREICNSIPSLWYETMQYFNGQGGVTGEAIAYDSLFAPLLNAMDNTKEAIDTKLQEYADAWTQFNSDLGSIIGVSSEGRSEKKDSGKGNHGIQRPSGDSSKKGKEQSGTDTIVGTITSGGEAAVEALNEVWIPGFEDFASSVDGICSSVCSMVEDMSNEVIKMVNASLKALKELKAKNTGAYKIDKVSNGYGSHAVSSANAFGTLASADGRGAITKGGTSLVNELGEEGLVRDGVLYKIPGGAHTIKTKPNDVIFNHKQMAELEKYDRVTSNGGHGKLIGSFASGTVDHSKISILENNIRDIWNNDDFKKLLDKVTELKSGQDTIIDQNKEVLRDENGNPYPEGTIIIPNGEVLRPLQPGDRGWELMQAFQPLVDKIRRGEDEIISNAVFGYQKQMERWVNQINNSNVVNNIANNKPSVTIGDIHVTCPGVTSQQVAEQLGNVIGKELDRQFSGFSNYTDQMSRIR